jgi:hypothetical protein
LLANAQEPGGKDEKSRYASTADLNIEQISPKPVFTEAPQLNTEFLGDLLKQNFTFDAVLTMLSSSDEIVKTPIRAIMDTGSEGFLINEAIAHRAGLSESVKPVQVPCTLQGLKNMSYDPTHCVKVTWHVPKHMNSREDVFYVVNDAPFDILIPNILSIGTRNLEVLDPEGTSSDLESGKKKKKRHVLYIGKPWRKRSRSIFSFNWDVFFLLIWL